MKLSGTAHANLRKPLTPAQIQAIESVPAHHRPGALWRTLKFGHPFPRHRAYRENRLSELVF